MHTPPVPALPAIRIVIRIGKANQIQKSEQSAVTVTHMAPEVVRARCRHYCSWTILTFNALDLIGNDIRCFFPTDALILRFTSPSAVPFSIGIEIDPFERI
jgi:hypothetical protein